MKADYKTRPWAHNDAHAFGPIVLAYAQAAKMGIREITPTLKPGCFASPEDTPGKPRTYVFYNPEAGQNVGWENDRIAFRVYGPSVRNRVGSGIDIWAKSVEFPIIDKWYRLNAAGHEYHIDRGEGCDFYDVGKLRGSGGSALWRNGRAFPPETYATQSIIVNTPDEVKFTLVFDPWDADGLRVSEKKTIRMVPGTNFFQVEHTVIGDGSYDITVGVGVTTFGQPSLKQHPELGALSSWEKINTVHGSLGVAVVADAARLAGFAEAGKDRYILIKAKLNEPFIYFIGAGWDGSYRFKTEQDWEKAIQNEATWAKLNVLYRAKTTDPRAP
jgi:hypothetical protein